MGASAQQIDTFRLPPLKLHKPVESVPLSLRRMAGAIGRSKPGPRPKRCLLNPYPIEHVFVWKGSLEVASTDCIDGSDLDPDEQKLRAFFKIRAPLLKQQPGENLTKAVRRIRELAAVALDYCNAAKWSDRNVSGFVVPPRRYARATWSRYHAKKHVGTRPPKRRPANGCLWLDTSHPKRPLRTYNTKAKKWVTTLKDTSKTIFTLVIDTTPTEGAPRHAAKS